MNKIKTLLAYSNHGFGSHSSYPMIAKYISNSKTISVIRKEPQNISARILNRVIRSFSTSQWYRPSSMNLEWLVTQCILTGEMDLVHFLWADRDLGYIHLLNKFKDFPVFCTFHCCPEDLHEILHFKKRLRTVSKIIIMSESQRDFFEQSGVDAHNISFIPHGIDTDFFNPSSQKESTEYFTVLSVGSYKRNFKLLREVAVLLTKHREIKIKIVAPPEFKLIFSDLSNVELIHNLTDIELLNLYRSSSCLLLTVENATANNALLEGLACGLPIVTERIGGIPDYVNSDCSIMIESKNADLLAESILNLSIAPLKLNKMCIAARERALELSWSNAALQTEALYRTLI